MPRNTSRHHLIPNRICRLLNLQYKSQPSDRNYCNYWLGGGRCSSENRSEWCILGLEKLTAVVVLHFCRQVKRCFAVAAETNLLLTCPQKDPSVGNLQLEFRNFSFLGQSLKRFRPEHKPFRLKTFVSGPGN